VVGAVVAVDQIRDEAEGLDVAPRESRLVAGNGREP